LRVPSVSEDSKRRLIAVALMLGVFAAGTFFGLAVAPPGTPLAAQTVSSVEPVFSPGSEERLIAFVDSARNTLDVELYQFSNSALKDALVHAASRGVAVRLILEPKVDANLETAQFLSGKGVAVRWASPKFANLHAKSAVVDAKCVLVGSINWSQRAVDSNREAALIACGALVASPFESVFDKDWSDASAVAPA